MYLMYKSQYTGGIGIMINVIPIFLRMGFLNPFKKVTQSHKLQQERKKGML